MENDISEQERYSDSLTENNDENDLYHVIDSVGNNDSGILNSCIYIDVNESKQNLYLKLISPIHNFSNENNRTNKEDKTPPIIIYNDHSYSKPLNNWDNPNLFPFVFPTLFFYRDDGHIAP